MILLQQIDLFHRRLSQQRLGLEAEQLREVMVEQKDIGS
jgi:hypothetical protein